MDSVIEPCFDAFIYKFKKGRYFNAHAFIKFFSAKYSKQYLAKYYELSHDKPIAINEYHSWTSKQIKHSGKCETLGNAIVSYNLKGNLSSNKLYQLL